ncbi:RecX family transcriptional regulator [Solirubrobacter taibaiensis]|nr:RecX family transcriptional regulator [Solirubrobacter taibaiensis]
MLIRTTIGLGAAAAGLTALTYGIAQAIENGSCGVDEYGNTLGAPCPEGFGPMIVLMVLGSFVALAGAALASSLVRFILPIIVAVCAGVVLGFLDVHETDTRPGLEIIAVVAAPMVLFTVPFVGKRRTRGFVVQPQHAEQFNQMAASFSAPQTPPPPATEPTFTAPAPQWEHKHTPGDPEAIAARLRQLDQLKESGLLDDAAYAEQRKRILAEL